VSGRARTADEVALVGCGGGERAVALEHLEEAVLLPGAEGRRRTAAF
jgi:hypothetical protein